MTRDKQIVPDKRIHPQAQQMIAQLMEKGQSMRKAKRTIKVTAKRPVQIGSYKRH